MKIKYLLIGLAVAVVLVGLRFSINILQDSSVSPAVTTSSHAVDNGEWVEAGGGWAEAAQSAAAATEKGTEKATDFDAESTQLIEKYGFSPEKIAALRAAKDGDPRTPPIKRGRDRVLPSAAQLADPELYLQYEEAQTQQAFAGFVKAVDPKVNQIRAHMASLEQYEFPDREKFQRIADEKIAALEKMKAELLARNPELLEIQTPLLDLSQFEQDTAAMQD